MTIEIHKGRIVANISAPLAGTIEDWPANIQDRCYALIAQVSELDGVGYSVVHSESNLEDGVAYIAVVVEAVKFVDDGNSREVTVNSKTRFQ